jgi:hypothetical protein
LSPAKFAHIWRRLGVLTLLADWGSETDSPSLD